jgi:uncharacterized protein
MGTTPKPADAPELQPAREQRTVPLDAVEWRASGAGDGELTVRGHAAVFNRTSLDLGGFRERIAPGAFANALDANPDVHALWDHDTKFVLARTTNKTLELREDPIGLHFWAKVANTSYAKDLRLLMERGDVDQASFAFTVARDEWTIDDKEQVTRTILEVDQLYDVTVTAQGAYPQTDTSVVKHLRSRLTDEITEGRLPDSAAAAIPDTIVAPDDPAGEPEPQEDVLPDAPLDSGDERTPAPAQVEDASSREADEEKRADELAELRKHTAAELATAKRRLLDAERKRT